MDVLAPGIGEIIGGSQREERLEVLDARRRNAASTKSTTAGTEIYAATVRCRTRVLASASSAPSLTSRASPMCATRFPSRERPEMPDIDAQDFRDRGNR